MKRSGLLVAAGVIGILRGSLGTLSGVGSFALVGEVEQFYPGYGLIVAYEFALSVTVLVVSIYALAKANDPSRAGAIRAGGIALVIGGVIDVLWGFALFGATAEAASAALGSLAALTLIGGLLIVGARGLRARA